MQSKYYRLGVPLDANKIMNDIAKMIDSHTKINKLEDTILKIEIKDISYTHDGNLLNDRKNPLPE